MSGLDAPPQQGQQSYRTPPDFLAAVLRRLGWESFECDMACTTDDAVAPLGLYLNAGLDALAVDWQDMGGMRCWLNPPFGLCKAFAAKCAASSASIAVLMPASVGSAWFAEYVDGRADVIFLRPRITFLEPDGTPCAAGINRDCMLLVYDAIARRRMTWCADYSCEDWRKW